MVVVSAVVSAGEGERDRRLKECLASIEAQTLGGVEAVVADSSAGVGAARNEGARRAVGEFLVFLDAGERVPPYAFGAMAEGLRASGSDFATAAPPGSTAGPVRGTHVTERPALLADRSAAGRMWRRSFWETAGLSFPEGVAHGDMRVVVPAHFLASAVDVLDEPLLLGPDPAAAGSAAPEELFALVRATASAVAEIAGAEARAAWDAEALSADLADALRRTEEADEASRRAFTEIANSYIDTVDPRVFQRLPVIDRLKWYLVRRHMHDELLRVLAFEREAGPEGLHADALAVRHGTRWYVDYPFLDDPLAEVPQAIYRLTGEIDVQQRAESARWEDGRLVVSGRLHMGFLPPDSRFRQYLRARAVNPGTGAKARVRIRPRKANAFELPRGAVTTRRDWGGYELSIDPRDLRANDVWRPGEWTVELWAVNRSTTRRATLAWPDPGAASRPGPHEAEPGVWIRPEWRGEDGLRLVVDTPRVRITGSGFTGEGAGTVLELTGTAAPDVPGSAVLRLTRRPGDVFHEVEMERDLAPGLFTARVPAELLLDGFAARRAAPGGPAASELWDVHVADGARVEYRVAVEGEGVGGRARVAEDRTVGLEPDGPGWALLRAGVERPLISGAEWKEGELRVSGPFAAPERAAELVLTDTATGERGTVPVAVDGDGFSAVLPTAPDEAPADGRYALSMVLAVDGASEERPVDVDPALLESLPFAGTTSGRPFALDAGGPAEPLFTAGPEALP